MSFLYLNVNRFLFSVFVLLFFSVPLYAQPSAFLPEGDKPDWERALIEEETLPEDLVERFIVSQPLTAKVAQLMLVTLEGLTGPSVNDVAFFKSCLPGGVVMPHAFKPGTAASYVNALHAVESSSGLPFLIAADLYQLTRATRNTPSQFVQLPSLLSITAAGESATTRRLGRFMAEHLRSMGFNLHLGPSLLLAPTLDSAVASLHTFGSDPHFAAEAGVIFYDAFAEAGIEMMPMNYPGGGANHIGRGASVLTTPRSILAIADALPYHELIQHGAKIIHVGNVLVPTLDLKKRPASLSPVVMKDILRGEAGFEGVIVSGPLDDEVLESQYDSCSAAVQAIMAGADMLFWNSDLLPVMRAVECISRLVDDGKISEERIDESLRRILIFKQGMVIPEKAVSEEHAKKISRQKALLTESMEIERRAITLIRNKGNVLPLIKKVSTPVGVTGVTGVDELQELLNKKLKPVSQQRIVTARHIGEIQRFEIERLTRHLSGIRTMICILTDDMRVESQIELLRALKEKVPHLVLIYLGNPVHVARLNDADVVLLAYCDPVMLNQTMSAMAEILLGNGPISIMPIPDKIQLRVGETRSFNGFEVLRVPSGRLPIALSDQLPAGSFARYNPQEAVKRIEWDFAGKRIRKEIVVHSFDKPGIYSVSLIVTDTHKDVQKRTFTVEVAE
ncbi:MAG: hypothetical protein KAH38_12890 [Candidatus Hydrogenedentes bacterium]|nr:hypothetical protein [Candidatus Hydrogenedentota bacterium]